MNKNKILFTAVITLVVLFAATIARGSEIKMPRTIVFGTVYNIHHDEFGTDSEFFERVERDIPNIAKHHFNSVMVLPLGQWDRETRSPDFIRTDFLVDRIEQEGLGMIPIIQKSNHRAWMPMWMWLEMEGEIFRTGGSKLIHESVNYQHPGVRKALENYMKLVTERYGDRPSILAYNVWNEPHFYSEDPLTIEVYRKWLKDKYSSLDSLNRVWGEDYGDWQQITPELGGTWESSMTEVDWELFRHDNNGILAAWTMRTMRKYDNDVPLIINPVDNYVCGSGSSEWNVDNWRISEEADIPAISFYPGWWEYSNKTKYPIWRMSMVFNATRCAAMGKPWWLGELQTHMQNGLSLSKYMSCDDIHLMSWTALANDCKGIVWWKWLPFFRGQQNFGRGLCRTDGTLAPRGQAASDVGEVIARHGRLLKEASLVPPRAAILYDQAGRVKVEHEPTFNPPSFVLASFQGTFRALWEENIEVDVLRARYIENADQLSQYDIVFLPFYTAMRPSVARALKEYVRNGGQVVADARSAVMNHMDFGYPINPGPGLVELFGARRLDWYARDGAFEIVVEDAGLVGNAVEEGTSLNGMYYRETLEVRDGARVAARFPDDAPAIVVNEYGKGKTFLCAVPLGGSYDRLGEQGMKKLISGLARDAGAVPEALLESAYDVSAVSVKVHRRGDEKIVYLVNTGDKDVSGTLRVRIGNSSGEIESEELISGEILECMNTGGETLVPVSLDSFRAEVIHLR